MTPAIFLSRDDCIMHAVDADKDGGGYWLFSLPVIDNNGCESLPEQQREFQQQLALSTSTTERPPSTEDKTSRQQTSPVRALEGILNYHQ